MKLVPLTLVCLVAIALGSACGKREEKQTVPLTPYASLRDQVVDLIKNEKLTPDASGVAQLPKELQAASNDAQVHIAKDVSAGLLVAFDMSISPRRKEYLLHAERDLPETVKTLRVGSLDLNVAGKGENHWYHTIAR